MKKNIFIVLFICCFLNGYTHYKSDAGYFYSSLNNIKIDYMGQKVSLKDLNGGKDALISRLDFSIGIKLYF
jgi:hypothetical protein